MTGKCKSIKNLILIASLVILAIIMGVMGTTSVYAATDRETYSANIQQYYDTLINMVEYEDGVSVTLVEKYNGTEVLESVKSSADYLIGYKNLRDGTFFAGTVNDSKVEEVYLKKMAELNAIYAVIEKVTAFEEFYAGLSEDRYNKIPWDDIERIRDDFLNEMDILELFTDGNLTEAYIQSEYENAINRINGIEVKPEQEDLTEFKKEQKNILHTEYQQFVNSSYYYNDSTEVFAQFFNGLNNNQEDIKANYSEFYIQTYPLEDGKESSKLNTIVEQQLKLLCEAMENIDKQETRSGIIAIKSNYLSQLRSSVTIIEEAYDYYIDTQVNTEKEQLSLEEIASIINLYATISSGSYTLTPGRLVPIQVAHSRLLNVYRLEKLAEVEDIYYKENLETNKPLINRYSKQNRDELSIAFEDARIELKSASTISEINAVVDRAKERAERVPTNVQTIYSQNSQYTVKITATDNQYAFAPTAYVVVEDYEFYPVKKNVNRLLRKLDAGEGLKYEVKYYIDFTIIDENGRELEETEQTYQVELAINEDIATALGNDYKVIYYFNGSMDGYTKDGNSATLDDIYKATITNKEGGQVLMFTTTHFSPYALCGTVSANSAGLGDLPIYQNPFFYCAILLLGIIAIIITFIALKHWKYKVIFKNNGGTRVKTLKFKKTEPIVMPKAPTKQGFIFGGWYTDKKLAKRFVQYRLNKRKTIKLWAKWIPLNQEVVRVDDYYQALRMALDDYERVGVQIGLKEEDSVARIIISNDKVLLFVCGNVEKYKEMGYNVTQSKDEANKDIPVKFIVSNEDELYQGLEIIDIAMKIKGFTEKAGDPEMREISEQERKEGFIFTFKNEKVADTLKEWFELLRLQAKSFVMVGDSGTPRDLNGKYIVKAKRYEDRIDLYLPLGNENSESVAGDILYKDVPNKFVIKTPEDVAMALEAIAESMTSLGMKKYPRNASQLKTSADTDTAFGYKIRFN